MPLLRLTQICFNLARSRKEHFRILKRAIQEKFLIPETLLSHPLARSRKEHLAKIRQNALTVSPPSAFIGLVQRWPA